MRLRNRRTAEQTVDADGTARCSRCDATVPVRADGSCDLGHRVTSPEHVAAAAASPEAGGAAAAPETHHAAEVPDADEGDLIRDAFGASTFGVSSDGAGTFDDGHAPPYAAAGSSLSDEVLPTRPESVEQPTSPPRPAARRTAVALEELLDFGLDVGPSALDDEGRPS